MIAKTPVVLIGYGGHGYVAADILLQSGHNIPGYCDSECKQSNPYHLAWLGAEDAFFSDQDNCTSYSAFISIGNGIIREKVFRSLQSKNVNIINAQHPTAVIAGNCNLGKGIFIAANATINPLCAIGDGVICNTSISIDHECVVGSFTHICPGSVLCGNVTVGNRCFIGARSVVIPGVRIADNVVIGAGSSVVRDITEAGVYAGSPAKLLK